MRLRGFRPSAEKVYHVDVHPTLPWIVSSDGDDKIVLWDWEHSQASLQLLVPVPLISQLLPSWTDPDTHPGSSTQYCFSPAGKETDTYSLLSVLCVNPGTGIRRSCTSSTREGWTKAGSWTRSCSGWQTLRRTVRAQASPLPLRLQPQANSHL